MSTNTKMKTLTTTTHQPPQQGLALCSRCHPAWASVAPQWVPAKTPTVHRGPYTEKAVGGPTDASRRDTTTRPNVTNTVTEPNLSNTNMVAEPVLGTADFRRSRKPFEDDKTLSDHNTQNEIAQLRTCTTHRQHSRSGEAQCHQEVVENGTHHPGEDQPGDQAHQKSAESIH